jgi:hypothetical protein
VYVTVPNGFLNESESTGIGVHEPASLVVETGRQLLPLLNLVGMIAEVVGGSLKVQFEAVGAVIKTIADMPEITIGRAERLLANAPGGGGGGGGLPGLLPATSGLGLLSMAGERFGFFGGRGEQPGRAEGLRSPRQELTPRGGGSEAVGAINHRLQAALNRVDTPELRAAQETNRLLERIFEVLRGRRLTATGAAVGP